MVEKYPGQVKVVFKNFPLRSHPLARPAAQAALAAHAQGKFWKYHDRLFASVSSLDAGKLERFAAEAGLDLEKFKADRANPQLNRQIDQDLRLGQEVGVRGTPTVFVNGRLVQERSLEGASRVIEAELQRLQKK